VFSVTPSDEGRPITDFAHQLEYDGLIKDVRAVLAELTPIRREIHSRNGQWYDVRIRPYRTMDDRIDGVVITFVDVGERKQWEERQEMLLGELKHRVKNIITVVQAVASQTAREAAGRDFIDLITGRLAALASAHDLLVQSEWKGADLEALVRSELKPYESKRAERIRISGAPVLLPSAIATPFGLVLHELAVNAAKHGSLSVREGDVEVSWTVAHKDGKQWLTLIWREQGGPAVAKVKSAGGGSALIEHALPGARIRREFESSGLVCSIDTPLPAPDERI
jgi:two-component system CheB/CheR fusion protein